MAYHKITTLLNKGFTQEDLDKFLAAGLMVTGGDHLVKTTKSPSSWPVQYKKIWSGVRNAR